MSANLTLVIYERITKKNQFLIFHLYYMQINKKIITYHSRTRSKI